MKLIAHRGNTFGRDPVNENRPETVINVINAGYDCEVDLRIIDGIFYLGHDTPDYLIEESFLFKYKTYLWIHAKNKHAVTYLMGTDLHWFWHQNDSCTLTSKGYLWCYPGKYIDTPKSVCVLPNNLEVHPFICTDFPALYN